MNRTIMSSIAAMCAVLIHIVEIFRVILIFNTKLHYMQNEFHVNLYGCSSVSSITPSLKLSMCRIGNESP
jgi:hypothetical protein